MQNPHPIPSRGKRLRGTPTSPPSPSEEGGRNLFHRLGVECPWSGMSTRGSVASQGLTLVGDLAYEAKSQPGGLQGQRVGPMMVDTPYGVVARRTRPTTPGNPESVQSETTVIITAVWGGARDPGGWRGRGGGGWRRFLVQLFGLDVPLTTQ